MTKNLFYKKTRHLLFVFASFSVLVSFLFQSPGQGLVLVLLATRLQRLRHGLRITRGQKPEQENKDYNEAPNTILVQYSGDLNNKHRNSGLLEVQYSGHLLFRCTVPINY